MRSHRSVATYFGWPLLTAALTLAGAALVLGASLRAPLVLLATAAVALAASIATALLLRWLRPRAEADALALQERQLFGVIAGLPWAVVMFEQGRIVYANPAAVAFLGHASPEPLLGQRLRDLVPPTEADAAAVWFDAARREAVSGFNAHSVTATGALRPTRLAGAWVVYGERRMFEIQFTDRADEQRALDEANHLATFPRLNPQPVVELSADGTVVYANPAAQAAMPDLAAWGAAHPFFAHHETFQTLLAAGAPHASAMCRVGDTIYEQQAVRAPEGETIRLYGHDVTHREQAREALRASEERFNLLFRLSPVGKSVTRLSDGRLLEANERFANLLGYDTVEEVVGRTVVEIGMWDSESVRARIAALLERSGRVLPRVITVRTRTGAVRRALAAAERIEFNGEPCILGLLLDVEERERLRAEVRAERDFARSILDTAGQGLLICDADNHVQYVNPALLKMTGYAQEEAFALDPLALLHPADQEEVLQRSCAASATGEGYRCEARVLRRDGSYLDALVAAVPRLVDGERVGTIFVVVDITEQRQAAQQLEGLRRFYEHILHGLPLDVIVMDPEGRYLFLNEHAVRDPEVRQRLIGARDPDYAHLRGRDAEAHSRRQTWMEEVIRTREMSELEETIDTPEGPRYLLRVARPVLDATGEVAYVVGYSLDLTARKRFEAQLVRARDEAEELSALKSTFIANMSHEVRTPLTAVIGFAEVLQDEIDEPQLQELAALIHQSGTRLLETLNSVLDLARMQAGALHLRLLPTDLGPLTSTTVNLFRAMAKQKGLALEADLPAGPIEARVDAPAFNRVMNNLLSNAIKFTDAGTVRVRLSREAGRAVVRVIDTGVGMDEAFLAEAFEAFRQESIGLARSHPGSGLGLAIVKRLVEMMAGEISIESAKGEGTTVCVSFPMVDPTSVSG